MVVFPIEGVRRRSDASSKPYPGASMLVKELVTRVVLASVPLVASGCNFSEPSQATEASVEPSVAKFWESGATVYWNSSARSLFVARGFNPFQAIRGFAVLSVAQYDAAVTAEATKDRGEHPSVRAAVAEASIVVLSYLVRQAAAALAAELETFLASSAWPGEAERDLASVRLAELDVSETSVPTRADENGCTCACRHHLARNWSRTSSLPG